MPKILSLVGIAGFGVAAAGAPAMAAVEPSAGSTAWVLTSTALVLFMTLPGLALFYGGLVRARNVLSVLMHCFAICCVVSLLWALVGYSLAFGEGGSFIGDLNHVFLRNLAVVRAGTEVPEGVFAMFQMTFAIITPALIVGAFPERVNFPFVVLFSAAWLLFVYVPVAHWVWGGGWLAQMGVLDFAGGIVVHTTAGISALVAAVMVGARKGFPATLIPPHSPILTMIGAGMLWVGWFGFNGGSALGATNVAGNAILVTHLAAAAGAVTWLAAEWIKVGKPTSVGIVTGCIAGLATVTPASGYIGPGGGMAIGAAAGLVCFNITLVVKQRFKIDDSLDVFAVHGVGGMLGSLLLSAFALPSLGGVGLAEGMDGLHQLGVQVLAVVVVGLWSGIATYVLVKLLGAVTRVRVTEEQEREGLDLVSHGERGYDLN